MSDSIEQKLKEELSSIQEELYDFRHELHRHPELSGKEYETAAKIRKELDALGLSWRAVGGTGTLAELQGSQPGPTIILRADIDALPIKEKSSYPYPSEHEGVMHACGHDVHATALLGAAKILTAHKEELKGSVRFVFQQAEEFGHGSQYFLKEDVTAGVDRIYGFHVSSGAPLGSIILTDGPDAASCDYMRIELQGKSAHIAKPHLGHDATLAAADVVLHLRELLSGFNPMDSSMIGIGRISSGNAWNVISDYAEIEGTIRTLSPSAREGILAAAEDTIRQVAALYGVTAKVEFEQNTPVLINDYDAYQTMYAAALDLLGDKEKILRHPVPLGFGGDDFAAFAQRVPGCFAHVGIAIENRPDTTLPMHSENILIDDQAVVIGSELLIRCALSHLKASE